MSLNVVYWFGFKTKYKCQRTLKPLITLISLSQINTYCCSKFPIKHIVKVFLVTIGISGRFENILMIYAMRQLS